MAKKTLTVGELGRQYMQALEASVNTPVYITDINENKETHVLVSAEEYRRMFIESLASDSHQVRTQELESQVNELKAQLEELVAAQVATPQQLRIG